MLTPSLLCLALTAAPAPAAATAPSAALAAAAQQRISIGCNKPKCRSRKDLNRMLDELAGVPLYLAYRQSVSWLVTQSAEGQGARVEGGGKDVAATAMLSLAMTGVGSNLQAGFGRPALRDCVRALREWQDDESGAIGDPERPEYLLGQALATLALGEVYYADERPAQEETARKAVQALLAGRGEDGLWHADGADDAPVDALVTSLAGYALFVADDAGLEVPAQAFETLLAWTEQVAEQAPAPDEDGPLEREAALRYAGALCARLFCAQAIERPLAEDAATKRLALVVAAQVPEAPALDAEWTLPPRMAEADFAFLASLGLYQADNVAWGRCSRWFAAQFLKQVEPLEDDAQQGHFPAGDTGRLPGGVLGTTALRVLQMQSGVRELNLPVLVQ